MQMVVICEMYGWTYEDYLNQPVHFLKLIKEKLSIDAQKAKNATPK